jgi:hypothetical protein
LRNVVVCAKTGVSPARNAAIAAVAAIILYRFMLVPLQNQ